MKNCQFQTGLPHYFKFTLILSMGNSETETECVFREWTDFRSSLRMYRFWPAN